MEETRIIDVRREQGGTTYVTAAGTYIKKTRNKFDFYIQYKFHLKYSHN